MARAMQWGTAQSIQLAIAGARVVVDLSINLKGALGLNTLANVTITRVLGELAIRPLAPTVSGLLEWTAGITVITEDAFAIGISAMPNPLLSQGDFLWWAGGTVGPEGSEVSDGFYGARTHYVRIDSRGQRRVREANRIPVLLIQNHSGSSMTFGASLRTLYKMP